MSHNDEYEPCCEGMAFKIRAIIYTVKCQGVFLNLLKLILHAHASSIHHDSLYNTIFIL